MPTISEALAIALQYHQAGRRQAAEQIYRQQGTPVVYLTAYSDRATVERARSDARFGYVLKPCSERDLLVAVEMAIHRSQQERQLKESQLSSNWFLGCAGVRHGDRITEPGMDEGAIGETIQRQRPGLCRAFGAGSRQRGDVVQGT